MIARIRKRMSYANVAMTLAVVLAMSGGAYAANKVIITSTKQIKKSVLKELEKPGPAGKDGVAGKAGAQGAQGIQGVAGVEGKAGEKGAPGATGPKGATGQTGPAGATGTTGPKGTTGEPWTPNSVLPVGATETGEWSLFTSAPKTGELRFAAISIPIQLAAPPAMHYIKIGETVPAECQGGTAAEPKATSGNLCIFEGESALHEGGLAIGGAVNSGSKEAFGPSKVGVDLIFQATATGEVSAEGSWAVTG